MDFWGTSVHASFQSLWTCCLIWDQSRNNPRMHCQRQLFNKIRNRDVIFFIAGIWIDIRYIEDLLSRTMYLQTVLWTGGIEWPRKHINYTNGLSFNYSTLMHIKKKKFPLNWSKTHCRMFENQKCSEHYLCSQLINIGSCAVLKRCTPQENTFFFKFWW